MDAFPFLFVLFSSCLTLNPTSLHRMTSDEEKPPENKDHTSDSRLTNEILFYWHIVRSFMMFVESPVCSVSAASSRIFGLDQQHSGLATLFFLMITDAAKEWDIWLYSHLCWELHMLRTDHTADRHRSYSGGHFFNTFNFSLSFKLSANWTTDGWKSINKPAAWADAWRTCRILACSPRCHLARLLKYEVERGLHCF